MKKIEGGLDFHFADRELYSLLQIGKRKEIAWREMPFYTFGRRADFTL